MKEVADVRECDDYGGKEPGLVRREEVDKAAPRVVEQEVQGFIHARGLGDAF